MIRGRLERGRWPLNQRTPHQSKLSEGDLALLYAAGSTDPDAHQIIAAVKLAAPPVESEDKRRNSTPIWLQQLRPPDKDVPLGNHIWLKPPVNVKPLAPQLEFIRNPENWGVYLQGGIRHITTADAKLILGEQFGRV